MNLMGFFFSGLGLLLLVVLVFGAKDGGEEKADYYIHM